MRRELDVETIQDFCQYYERGWIGLGENPTVPILLRVAESASSLTFHKIIKSKDGTFTLDNFSLSWKTLKDEASFGCPDVGMSPYGLGEVIFGASYSERQTKRGLNLSRLVFTDFNRWFLREKLGQFQPSFANSSNYSVIWHYFNPVYKHLGNAFAALDMGASVGEALSNKYALFTRPDKRFPILAYKQWPIGYVPHPDEIVLGEQYAEQREDVQNTFPGAVVR